jgi:quercetin dioxygenase-like cupin family protein
MSAYGFVADLRAEVTVPAGGILSRTIHEDERCSLVVFAFDAGQELTEHTSAHAALIEILDGQALVTLDGEARDAGPGAWISMPPGMRHAIQATTPLVMALTLLR